MPSNNYYNFSTVKKSLFHFLTGKVFSAFSTFMVLLIIARALPKEVYGVYVIFQAMVNWIGMFASFGIGQSIHRYLPELRSKNHNSAMYKLLFYGIVSRFGIFAFTMIAFSLFKNQLAEYFNFIPWAWLLPWYLVAGCFSLTGLFLAKAMESLMWQKTSQYTLAFTGLLRLMLICWFYFIEQRLNFQIVIRIAILIEGINIVLLVLGTLINWRKDEYKNSGDPQWWVKNRKRVNRYGVTAYIKTLTSIFYGQAPNRFMAAKFLPLSLMGGYGFAGSVSMFCRRFLPTRLFQGMIRPLYISRYSQNQDFEVINRMGNMVFRSNLIVLVLGVLVLVIAGEPIIDLITNGKYGATCYWIAGIMCVLILESLFSQQELICLTLEKNGILIVSKLLMSASLVVSLFFISRIGVWAIIAANAIGCLLAIYAVFNGLRREGFLLSFDGYLLIRVLIAFLISIIIGLGIRVLIGSVTLSLLSTILIYVGSLLFWSPFTMEELQIFQRLVFKKKA